MPLTCRINLTCVEPFSSAASVTQQVYSMKTARTVLAYSTILAADLAEDAGYLQGPVTCITFLLGWS